MPAQNLFVAAALSACFAAQSSAEEAPKTPSRPVTIIASPAILPKGATCRIVMQPEKTDGTGTTFAVYDGVIKQATKDKIVLTKATIEWHAVSNSPFARLPFFNRYFKNTGTAQGPVEDDVVEIPVDQIRSIRLVEEKENVANEFPALPLGR